ncbi:hypothetical protein NUW54_g10069 [Trametes sanguinea]|uniref:Uncharacterized protein n=1 Tax=Trametes sanguinea TaxID=158606 RepID=A0ACC1P400_9APHY|nr:hypothetical protein NUW54_g10069 [Trametes sanguinea]
MRTFVLAHPGTNHDFHWEVRAVLDTTLICTHQLADLSLGKVIYQVLNYPSFIALLSQPPTQQPRSPTQPTTVRDEWAATLEPFATVRNKPGTTWLQPMPHMTPVVDTILVVV